MKPGDFYEDDEPIEKLEAAFSDGTPCVSGIPVAAVHQAVKLSAEEAAHLRWAAEARDMVLSEFIRFAALEKAKQPVVRFSSSWPS